MSSVSVRIFFITDEDEILKVPFAKFDGLVKSPKRANFKISHLIISTGYEIEI